jgi:ATP-dependent Clp endopeptidase proteolytic subunit ClpP
MKKFKILNKGKTAEIYIYEDIGAGWFGGISAKSFSEEMKKIKDAEQLNIYINSAGGDVFDGLSIYNQIKRHSGKKHVEIDGIAASIASVIAMAADPGELLMASNAMMMVHNPWGLVMGYADEMRSYADTLDKVRESILTTYASRDGVDEGAISDLMDAETWLDAEQAAEVGLVDTVSEEKQMAAHVDLSKFGYKNVPKELPSAVYTVQPEAKFAIRSKYKEMIQRGFH